MSSHATPSTRQRLTLNTQSTLAHDITAAFKASPPSHTRAIAVETRAPPPSPIDFGFSWAAGEDWRSWRSESGSEAGSP